MTLNLFKKYANTIKEALTETYREFSQPEAEGLFETDHKHIQSSPDQIESVDLKVSKTDGPEISSFEASTGQSLNNSCDSGKDALSTETRQQDKSCDKTSTTSAHPSYFSWLPDLLHTSENVMTRYINNLANFGSNLVDDADMDEKQNPGSSCPKEVEPNKDVITMDLPKLIPQTFETHIPQHPDGDNLEVTGIEDPDSSAYSRWMNNIYSQSEEVWQRMKRDFSEVVTVVATEPKQVVERTASSVRQHLASVATSAKELDPGRFLLIDEHEDESVEQSVPEEIDPDLKIGLPPSFVHSEHLADLRSGVSLVVNAVGRRLASGGAFLGFGPDERWKLSSDQIPSDKREARLQVLRADPTTYETEPPSPPATLGLHSYADWRAAYFDDELCQPRRGIPLPGIDRSFDAKSDAINCLEPHHPSPSELLATNPIMRDYLLRLVVPDSDGQSGGLTDADFWSRYYYRVWLLDVTERRRQQVMLRASTSTATAVQRRAQLKSTSSADDEETGQSGQMQESNLQNDWAEDESDGEWQEADDHDSASPEAVPPVATDLAPASQAVVFEEPHSVTMKSAVPPEYSSPTESTLTVVKATKQEEEEEEEKSEDESNEERNNESSDDRADDSSEEVEKEFAEPQIEEAQKVVAEPAIVEACSEPLLSSSSKLPDGQSDAQVESDEVEPADTSDTEVSVGEDSSAEEDHDEEEAEEQKGDSDEEEEEEEDEDDANGEESDGHAQSIGDNLQLPKEEQEVVIAGHSRCSSSGTTPNSNASSLIVLSSELDAASKEHGQEMNQSKITNPEPTHRNSIPARPSRPDPFHQSTDDWGDFEADQTEELQKAEENLQRLAMTDVEPVNITGGVDEEDDWENWS